MDKIRKIEKEVTDFVKIRDVVRAASGDYVDLKAYDPNHIRNSAAKRAFYDYLNGNADVAEKIHDAVLASRQDSFRGNKVSLLGGKLILQVRKESTSKQRENILNEWCRKQMKQIVPDVLAKCENIVGIQAHEWHIKICARNGAHIMLKKTYLVEFAVG